jgi:hypothetical protein
MRDGSFVQIGLFDSRAVRTRDEVLQLRASLEHESDARARLLEADSLVFLPRDPEIAFLLLPC